MYINIAVPARLAPIELSTDTMRLGLIGPSGAGKTTLLRAMAGLVDVKGTISGLPANLGYIFQHDNLLSQQTILANITLGRPYDKERLDYLLEKTDIKSLIDRYPSELSGGQRQRVAICRALLTGPELLLCDEPTSAQDPDRVMQFVSLIDELQQVLGFRLVIVSHDLSVIKSLTDEVIYLEDGQLVEHAHTTDFFFVPQSERAQKFVFNRALDSARAIKQRLSANTVLFMLSFSEESVTAPLISKLAGMGVTVNILDGYVEQVRGQTIGHLLVIISGDRTIARQFFGRHGVRMTNL